MSESLKNEDNLAEIKGTLSENTNRRYIAVVLVVIITAIIAGSFFMGNKEKIKPIASPQETKQPKVAFTLPTPQEQPQQVIVIDNTQDGKNDDEVPPPRVSRVNKARSTNAIVINNSNKQNSERLDYARNSDEAEQKVAESRGDLFLNIQNKAVIAKKITINPNFLLPKGSIIHCSLSTKIVSTLSGNIGCVVSQDVYSANGNVRLIERGSKIFGSYQSGGESEGVVDTRLFALWQEIKTPNNISIAINSGAVDSLGGAGMNGWVDNHFWKNFGNAILLSVFDDGMGILRDRMNRSNGNNNNDYNSSQNTINRLPEMILDRTANIPPTLYKNQGDQVAIFVAEDVDFSEVYKLIYKKSVGR